jgi:hypothetical protein
MVLAHVRGKIDIIQRDTDKTIHVESIDLLPPSPSVASTPAGSQVARTSAEIKRGRTAPPTSKRRASAKSGRHSKRSRS